MILDVVRFPDLEPEVVRDLKQILPSYGSSLPVWVATQRHPDGWKGIEVIVRTDGGTIVNRVTKEQDVAITIFVNHNNFNVRYSEANNLASFLEAMLPQLGKLNNNINSVLDVNVVPIDAPAETTQVRYFTFVAMVKGRTSQISY